MFTLILNPFFVLPVVPIRNTIFKNLFLFLRIKTHKYFLSHRFFHKSQQISSKYTTPPLTTTTRKGMSGSCERLWITLGDNTLK